MKLRMRVTKKDRLSFNFKARATIFKISKGIKMLLEPRCLQ